MIWIVALCYLIADAYVEHLREFKASVKNKPGVNHYVSTLYRFVYFFDLLWRFRVSDTWQIVCLAVGGFFGGWFLLNLLINKMGGHKWNAMGKTAWLDRLQTKYPEPVVFLQVIMGMSFVVFFYYHPW